MKNKKWLVICIAVIIAAGLWFWRYTSLNSYYDSINTVIEKVYQAGEIVPFGDSFTPNGAIIKGYAIRVDGFEVMEYEDFCQSTGLAKDAVLRAPDRVALVTITLFNEDNEADAVSLLDFGLHGIDSNVGLEWNLLRQLNPVLEGHTGVRIPKGEQHQFVLPYSIRQTHFGSYTWDNMEDYDWMLRTTYWPEKIDIVVNPDE